MDFLIDKGKTSSGGLSPKRVGIKYNLPLIQDFYSSNFYYDFANNIDFDPILDL